MQTVLTVFALILASLVVLVAFLAHRNWFWRQPPWVSRQLKLLRGFAFELGGEVKETEEGLSGTRMTARWEGRKVNLEMGDCTRDEYKARVAVEVDPSLQLRIRQPSLVGRLQQAIDARRFVQTGSEADDRFLIDTSKKSDVKQVVRDVFLHGGDELLEVLNELLEPGHTQEIVAEHGWLYLDCVLPSLESRYFRWLLDRMVKIARFYERRPIKIRRVERFAWTGGGATTKCPYCREGLSEETLDLVACDSCQTLHHGECFSEHGGCTIYGCNGRQREILAERA